MIEYIIKIGFVNKLSVTPIENDTSFVQNNYSVANCGQLSASRNGNQCPRIFFIRKQIYECILIIGFNIIQQWFSGYKTGHIYNTTGQKYFFDNRLRQFGAL